MYMALITSFKEPSEIIPPLLQGKIPEKINAEGYAKSFNLWKGKVGKQVLFLAVSRQLSSLHVGGSHP